MLADAGLDHVQISIQDSDAASADHIAGYDGASVRKRALAVKSSSLACRSPSTWSVHRANIGRIEPMVDLALCLAPAASRSRMCSITAGR